MNILIDLYHPAHFHLFRNAAFELQRKGHHIFWGTRDKDVVIDLLRGYNLEYEVFTRAQTGITGLFTELLEHDYKVYRFVQQHKINLMLGTSVSIAHVGRITNSKSIVFNEDDAVVVKLFSRLSYPFAHMIVTPSCLRESFGKKHIKYNGYQELAYLHPDHFAPNPKVLEELGVVEGDKFFILRFVSLQASHDIHARGLSQEVRRKLVKELLNHGRVFITSEAPLSEEFEEYRIRVSPEKIHSVLYFATMFVGDSQTMTAEAAVLGTPAIRCNTFVRRLSYLEELEYKYGLTYGFLPQDEVAMLDKVRELLDYEYVKAKWLKKRNRMLQEKINVANWMVDFIENYLRMS